MLLGGMTLFQRTRAEQTLAYENTNWVALPFLAPQGIWDRQGGAHTPYKSSLIQNCEKVKLTKVYVSIRSVDGIWVLNTLLPSEGPV